MGGYYTRVAGTTITAANENTYTRDQVISQFASSTARDAAITSPGEGMWADLADYDGLSRYSGSAWSLMPWSVVKKKNSNETVNSSSALQNDDDIFWSVSANAQYLLEMLLIYNSGTTPDIKFAFTGPASFTMTWIVTGFDTAGSFVFGNIDSESTVRSLGGTAADVAATARGIVTIAGTAGTLQLQWAQATSNASNTVLKAGSWGALTRFV